MDDKNKKFDFERLIVFQRTLELIELLKPLFDAPPRRAGKICEDLDRSSQSIAFNIAEGGVPVRGPEAVERADCFSRVGHVIAAAFAGEIVYGL